MKVRSILLLLGFVAFQSTSLGAQSITDIKKHFVAPPDDARIMMRWWWFGSSVTKQEIKRELRTMKAGGIGGVEVQPVYPLLPDDPVNGLKNLPYLSDDFLDMLKFAAQKSKELGLRFDLTLGSGWSFGGAKTPITEAAGQLRIDRTKIDKSTGRVPVPSMIPAEKLISVWLSTADPQNKFVNADAAEIREGNVWFPKQLEPGSEVVFFIAGKSGMQVKRPAFGAEGYVLNHLDKPSVENYLKGTGDRLFQAFDRSTIPYSVFCDSLEVYNQDWTDDLLTEFRKRRGYDLKPHLPALIADAGPKTQDIRYDWGRTITELFNDRFMIPMQEWAKRNGTRFRIQGYGIPPASISSNKWADISDGEGAQWKVVRASRWASSANHIFGRNVTSSETWTWLHSPAFRATPLDMKAEADIHFLQGINQLIGHGWGYTPPQVEYPGWRFYAAGAFSEQNPWWIVMPDLAKYLQRMSYLMRQGTPQNDVALYLPNADAYAGFTAGKVHLIDVERELVGDKIMPAIFEAGYNLDFFDDEILKSVGVVGRGDITLGSSKHRIVILPGIERMPLESLRKLEAFTKAGGILIATRRTPSKVPGIKTTEADQAEFTAIVRRLFDGTHATVKFVEKEDELAPTLNKLLQPDVAISPSDKDFGFVHRKTEDSDIYFVANTSNQRRSVQVNFRSSGSRPEIWDAMSGNRIAANVQSQSQLATTVNLDFEPYQSHVVIFSKSNSGTAKLSPTQTAASSMDISADWTVSFGTQPPRSIKTLHSWTDDEATRYFSGTAAYERSIDVPGNFLTGRNSVILDFGDGKAIEEVNMRNGMRAWFDPPIREAAVIYVNGQRAGSLWSPPYKLDIAPLLKAGQNELKIVVGNTAMNHMSGRKLPDYKLLNLRYGERFQPQDMDKVVPITSGLVGSVKLVSMK